MSLTQQLEDLQTLDLIKPERNHPMLEYAFKHVFTQESVYKGLLLSDRQQLHQIVGAVLEMTHAAGLDEIALRLAHHFEESGDISRALKYLEIAAKQANQTYANEEAKMLYQRILALLTASSNDNQEILWRTYLGLETIYDRLGEREQQFAMLNDLQTIAQNTQNLIYLGTVYQRKAVYFDRVSAYQESAEAAQAALRLAHQVEEERFIAQSLNLLAQADWRRFQYEAVKDWANQALDALRVVGEPQIRTTSLLHLGRASYRLGEYNAALDYIQAALELAHETDDRPNEALCHLILGWIYQRLGDYGAAEAQFQLDLEKRRAIGHRHGEAEALSHLGWVSYDQGAYEDGLRYCQAALDISKLIGDRENEAYALSGMGLAMEGLGNTAQARDYYQQALECHRAIGAKTLAMFDQSRLAKLALDSGDLKQASQAIEEVITWTADYGAESFWDPWLIHYTNYEILQANGSTQRAQVILEEAYALLQTRASRISDPVLRRCFLEQVTVNRLIKQAWQESG